MLFHVAVLIFGPFARQNTKLFAVNKSPSNRQIIAEYEHEKLPKNEPLRLG